MLLLSPGKQKNQRIMRGSAADLENELLWDGIIPLLAWVVI